MADRIGTQFLREQVRIPSNMMDKWIDLSVERARIGDLIEYEGRIMRILSFDVATFAEDLFSGRTIAIDGNYRLYIPPRLEAEELLELKKKLDTWTA